MDTQEGKPLKDYLTEAIQAALHYVRKAPIVDGGGEIKHRLSLALDHLYGRAELDPAALPNYRGVIEGAKLALQEVQEAAGAVTLIDAALTALDNQAEVVKSFTDAYNPPPTRAEIAGRLLDEIETGLQYDYAKPGAVNNLVSLREIITEQEEELGTYREDAEGASARLDQVLTYAHRRLNAFPPADGRVHIRYMLRLATGLTKLESAPTGAEIAAAFKTAEEPPSPSPEIEADGWRKAQAYQARTTARRMIDAVSSLVEDVQPDTEEEEQGHRAAKEGVEWLRAYFDFMLYPEGAPFAKPPAVDGDGIRPAFAYLEGGITGNRSTERKEMVARLQQVRDYVTALEDNLAQALKDNPGTAPRWYTLEQLSHYTFAGTSFALDELNSLYAELWEGRATRNITQSLARLNKVRKIIIELDKEGGNTPPEDTGAGYNPSTVLPPGFKEYVHPDNTHEIMREPLAATYEALDRIDAYLREDAPELISDTIALRITLGSFEIERADAWRDLDREAGRAGAIIRENNALRSKANRVDSLLQTVRGLRQIAAEAIAQYTARPFAYGIEARLAEALTKIKGLATEVETPAAPSVDKREIIDALNLDKVPGLVAALCQLETLENYIAPGEGLSDIHGRPKAAVEWLRGYVRARAADYVRQRMSADRDKRRYETLQEAFNGVQERREELKEELARTNANAVRTNELYAQRSKELGATIEALRADNSILEEANGALEESFIAYLFFINRLRACVRAHTDLLTAFRMAYTELVTGKILEKREDFRGLDRAGRAEKLLQEMDALAESGAAAGIEELKLLQHGLPAVKMSYNPDLE